MVLADTKSMKSDGVSQLCFFQQFAQDLRVLFGVPVVVEPGITERVEPEQDPVRAHRSRGVRGSGLLAGIRNRGHQDSFSQPASSEAQYVRTVSAPARLMPSTDSVMAPRRSIQPFAAAASIMAYSPEIW